MKTLRKNFLCIVIFFFIVNLFNIANAENVDQRNGKIIGNNVNLRTEANEDSTILLTLTAGEVVNILNASNNDWTHIEYNGVSGYIRSDLIFSSPLKGRLAYTLKDGINLRGSPGTSAYIVTQLEVGKPMLIRQMVDQWYYVEYGDYVGFVQKDLVSVTNHEGASSNDVLLKFGMEGSEVKRVQKELASRNFLSEKNVTGTYGSLTQNAIKEFQKAAGIKEADGVAGKQTLALLFDPDNNVRKVIETPKAKAETAKKAQNDFYGRVKTIDWWKGGSKLLRRPGGTATIYDIKSGKSWKIRRTGGNKHNDCAPLTSKDTAIMKDVYGGRWTHEKRPILLIVNGDVYAASLYGMPHGQDVQKNDNYPGMLCVHFTNSRTHGGNNLDSAHQSNIRYAYNKYNK